MLFTSLDFFLFLPLVLAVFALTPVAQRWACLLLASYVFYGFAQPFNLVYLGAVTLVVLGCGWGLARARQRPRARRRCSSSGLSRCSGRSSPSSSTTSSPARWSTPNLFASLKLPRLGITAPVGYSFYAFSAASYLIDIYVGRLPGQQGAGQVALFPACFPKILAGPIERATTLSAAGVGRPARRSRPAGARAAADRLGPLQEGRDRRQPCAHGRPELRHRGLRLADRPLDQRLFLRLPDLLRLLRLHRHRASASRCCSACS